MSVQPILEGVIPSVATPLTDAGGLDESRLRRLVRFLLRAGVHGFLANGTMGGFAFLTSDDQVRAISVIVDEVQGAVPVIGNIAETSTRRAIHQLKQVERTGVTFISVLTPFYHPATQDQLIGFYKEVAAASSVRMLLYDNPVMTKNRILPETVEILRREIPNLIGIKESADDPVNLKNLVDLTRGESSFGVFPGSERLMLAGLQMGCAGSIAGLHNICPKLAVDLFRAHRAGDVEIARDLQQNLDEVWHIFKYGNVWGGFDESLRYLGLAKSVVGAPYSSKLTGPETERIHTIIDQLVGPPCDESKR